jgi:hypothetical protein
MHARAALARCAERTTYQRSADHMQDCENDENGGDHDFRFDRHPRAPEGGLRRLSGYRMRARDRAPQLLGLRVVDEVAVIMDFARRLTSARFVQRIEERCAKPGFARRGWSSQRWRSIVHRFTWFQGSKEKRIARPEPPAACGHPRAASYPQERGRNVNRFTLGTDGGSWMGRRDRARRCNAGDCNDLEPVQAIATISASERPARTVSPAALPISARATGDT